MEISDISITKVRITEGTKITEGGVELLSSQEVEWMKVVAVEVILPAVKEALVS